MLGQATGRGGEGVGSLTDVQQISYAPRSLRAGRLYPRLGLPALGRLASRSWFEVGRFLDTHPRSVGQRAEKGVDGRRELL